MTYTYGLDSFAMPIYSDANSFSGSAQNRENKFYTQSSTGGIEIQSTPAHIALLGLRLLNDNWDSFGSQAPSKSAIGNALALLSRLLDQAQITGYPWSNPHVSASENGDVMLEWWNGEKKLALYIAPDRVDYLKSWGIDIEDEMLDGELERDRFLGLWRWLNA